MRRLSSIFGVIWLLVLWPAAVHAVTVNVTNNRNNFGKGDTFTTTISVAQSGSPVTADFYLALILPDQTPVFFQYNNGFVPHIATAAPSTWVKVASNVPLPNGFNSGQIPLFSYTMSGGEEPGVYQWIMAATQPGTLDIINIKSVPFFVSPGPVGALIGRYKVSTVLPSLGGSGTAILNVSDSSPGTLTISADANSAGSTASSTETIHYTDGTSGTEHLTATRQ